MDTEDIQFDSLSLLPGVRASSGSGVVQDSPNGTSAGSTGETLFDTPDGSPRHSVYLSRGGVGGSNSLKVGVIYVGNASDFCKGLIRGGKIVRWCTAEKDACTFLSHKEQKVTVPSSHWYIRGVRAGQAQAQPRLLGSLVPSGDSALLLTREEQPEVWKTYFASCEAEGTRNMQARTQGIEPRNLDTSSSSDEPGGSWEEVEAPGIEEFAQAEANLKTPGRRLGMRHPAASEFSPDTLSDEGAVEEIEELPVVPGEVTPGRMEDLQEPYLRIIAGSWNKIPKNFRSIRSMIERDNVSTRFNFEEIVKEIGGINRIVALVDARIGDKPISEEGASVWESIENVKADVLMLAGKQNRESDKFQHVEDDVKQAVEKLTRLSKNMNALYQSYLGNMRMIQARFGEIDAAVAEAARNSMGGGETDPFSASLPTFGRPTGTATGSISQEGFSAFSSDMNTKIRALQVEARSVRLELDGIAANYGRGSTMGGGAVIPPTVDGTLAKRVDHLEDRMKEAESNKGDVAYVSDDHHFSSVIDVKKYVEEEEFETCGVFWDVFSACVAMEPQFTTGKDIADEAYSAARIGSTTSELELAAAMGHTRPLTIFKADKKRADHLVCESFAEWNGENHNIAFKRTLKDMMATFVSGKKGELKAHKNTTFPSKILDTIKQQFNDILDWVGEFYGELTTVANFPPKPAWELCSRCLGTIFEAQLTTRSEIARLTQFKTSHAKAQVIWVVLQCHVLTQQFIKVNFRSHPAVVQQVSLFLLTERVDPRELVSFMDKIKESEKTAKEAVAKSKSLIDVVDKLKSELGDTKRKFNSLNGEVEAIKKKVAKL